MQETLAQQVFLVSIASTLEKPTERVHEEQDLIEAETFMTQ